jgi:hypothetical protein
LGPRFQRGFAINPHSIAQCEATHDFWRHEDIIGRLNEISFGITQKPKPLPEISMIRHRTLAHAQVHHFGKELLIGPDRNVADNLGPAIAPCIAFAVARLPSQSGLMDH